MSTTNSVVQAPVAMTLPTVVIRKKSVPPREKPKKKKVVLQVKSHAHPWEHREDLSDAYELPMSQREDWWRKDLKATPVPGAYESTDFIDELNSRSQTYNFKAPNRNQFKDFSRNGAYLLPGGCDFPDFIQILSRNPATYRFKAGERFAGDVLNFGLKDKYVTVPPNAYNTHKYLSIHGQESPVRNYMFRSQTKRIPTAVFGLKDGPAPGSYNVKDNWCGPVAITSCFKSKAPRFLAARPVTY